MKWNIRFLRVAMWVFRLLALIAVILGIALIFVDIFARAYSPVLTVTRLSSTPLIIFKPLHFAEWSLLWADRILIYTLPALILALIFFTLAALISLNLRFYAAFRRRP